MSEFPDSVADTRELRLEGILGRRSPLLVAYSGGVDSTLLLSAAHRVLGDAVTGVIADSPRLPRAALAEASVTIIAADTPPEKYFLGIGC